MYYYYCYNKIRLKYIPEIYICGVWGGCVRAHFCMTTLKLNICGNIKFEVYENIFNLFNVGNCGINFKVTIALVQFKHFTFTNTSRGLQFENRVHSKSKQYS